MPNQQPATARHVDLSDGGEARELALKALMTAHQFLTSAEREVPRIVGVLEGNEIEPVRKDLGQLLQGLAALTQLASDLQTLSGAPVEHEIDAADLTSALEGLVAAQENREWPEVGRILEARIVPVLCGLRSTFDRHAEALHAG
jgi:hypothetical protein